MSHLVIPVRCSNQLSYEATIDLGSYEPTLGHGFKVEVLKFFQASLRNYINCVHNCEDHTCTSFDFIAAVHI